MGNPMRNVAACLFTLLLFTSVTAQDKKDVPKAEKIEDALAKATVSKMEIDLKTRDNGVFGAYHERSGEIKLGAVKEGKVTGTYSYVMGLLTLEADVEGVIEKDKVTITFTEKSGFITAKCFGEWSPMRDAKTGKVVAFDGWWKAREADPKLSWNVVLVEQKPELSDAVKAALEKSEWTITYAATEKQLAKYAGDNKARKDFAKLYLSGQKEVVKEGDFAFKGKDGSFSFSQTVGARTDTRMMVKLRQDGNVLKWRSRHPDEGQQIFNQDSFCEFKVVEKDGKVVSLTGRVWDERIEFETTIKPKK